MEFSVPHISIAQQPQVEVHENGTQVVLICDAYSFGEEPNIAWKWYGYQVGIGRQLILKPVTKDNDGNYTCFASTTEVNKSVNSHLNVRCKQFESGLYMINLIICFIFLCAYYHLNS